MKKLVISFICVVVLVLTMGCTSKEQTQGSIATQQQKEQTYSVAMCDALISADVTMVSNGSEIVAMAEADDKNYAGKLFRVSPGDNTISMEEIAAFPDYSEPAILGIDGDNSLWLCGDQDDACFLLHTDSSGKILMKMNLNEQGDIYAVRSFAYDNEYIYLTVECARETTLGIRNAYDALFVYTKDGDFITTKYFEEIKSETLGFLDVEEDWMDDLETEEELPGELFAGQIKDRYSFITLSNREVGLMIERRAPIGTETYHIICTVTPGTLMVEPQFGYEVEVSETLVMSFPICGVGTDYDLLVWEPKGIFGVDIDAQEYVLLQSWNDLSVPNGGLSVNNMNQSGVGLSNGQLVFECYDGYTDKYSFAMLLPS